MSFWLIGRLLNILYTKCATIYDFVAALVSLNRWKTWVESIIPLLDGPEILELGCGPGHLQNRLFQAGFHPVGLDLSRQMAKLANHNNRSHKQKPTNPVIINGTAASIPFASGIFQNVAATFPTPYIFEPGTLAEIHRVLKENGRLVVLLAVWITGKSLFEQILAFLYRLTLRSQNEPDINRILSWVDQSGFLTSVKWIVSDNERLLIMIAQRE